MTDRRSQTSKANLGNHIPKPLDPEGARIVTVRVPTSTYNRLRAEAAQAGLTLSEHIRRLLDA